MVNLSLATSETWRDKHTGERVEKTEWHRVVIFNDRLCKVATDYLKKGSEVFLEGKLQTRKWQDQSGTDRYVTEVVLSNFDGKIVLIGGRSNGGGEARQEDRGGSGESGPAQARSTLAEDLDDEVPF